MGIQPKNRAMEIIERYREEAGMSKTEMAKHLPSRTKYYEHLEAKDIKFEAFMEYLKILGIRMVLAKEIIEP